MFQYLQEVLEEAKGANDRNTVKEIQEQIDRIAENIMCVVDGAEESLTTDSE